jgi:SAM-dependent methyltransferase
MTNHEPLGERVIESHYFDTPGKYLIYLFHKATYQFADSYIKDKVVLDYGCGTGYGSHIMSPSAKKVIGVDISADAVDYADSHYQNENLSFLMINDSHERTLPFENDFFDVVTSFQVIEHIKDPVCYLKEIQRVLKPGGVFLCATPDRSTRLLPFQKPWNMWHCHEYDKNQFSQLLAKYFYRVECLTMGGKPSVIQMELRRTNKLKWMTLPMTLPFLPDGLRIFCLSLLKKLFQPGVNSDISQQGQIDYDFGIEDIWISSSESPAVNLIAVATK